MWCKVACMSDRDDFAELIGSARTVIKCSSFLFNGRIRYGTKGEKVEERLLCLDAVKVYICSIKIPVKIESQFNILSIKLIDRVSDSHVLLETEEKQTHSLYGLHDKSSLQPFLIVLIRSLHAVFPHRLQAIVEVRPENEYDRLLRLSNEHHEESNVMSSEFRPCGGFSLRYECACDFYQVPCNRAVQHLVDTVYAHRISREFSFREFESLTQKDWLPIIGALRHNDWFTKITIENIKLSTENIDELCTVARLCKAVRDVRLTNCGLRHDFGTRFAHSLSVSHLENLDLSHNALEDKGLMALASALQQRKQPLVSIHLQSCSLTHKSLLAFNTAIMNNSCVLRSLQVLNLAGNRIKEENCLAVLFYHSDNVLEELHLGDIEFSLESFFHSLATMSCKLQRLFISSNRFIGAPTVTGGTKSFFTKNQHLAILQLSNANLSVDFLRELCDGLHSNVHLTTLDLRLSGNQLEAFMRDYAARFATIPSLTALDLAGCDLDNEIPTLLGELKKNRQLKSLHLGRNFNNIKQKNMQRTISAMKDLIVESDLDYFSIADSKLKENTAEFLTALTNNASLKILDVRGNLMGDAGARTMSHILQMNTHLHTVFFDRNLLSLNNFEDIVNAMDENLTIQYLPIPITDFILMKITEKDRMEKVQALMAKVDSICARNQQATDNRPAANSLRLTTAANLTREMSLSWENQQQLVGDQASLDYVLSCSNRIHNANHSAGTNEELNLILTRAASITKISTRLYESYLEEEERLKDEWNEISALFRQKFSEKNERLSRKFYQLFKEQTTINYDDKFQEQIRTFFAHSNENVNQLLNREMPERLKTYSRECYINVATCLQKRAYDITNDMALDMHKQLESAMFHTTNPQPNSMMLEAQQHALPSTLDRLVGRTNNVVHRVAPKHTPLQTEASDDTSTHRALKAMDSNECLPDPSPKMPRATARAACEKDARLLTSGQAKVSAPSSPKPPTAGWRKSLLVAPSDQEPVPTVADAIYSNVQVTSRTKKKELSLEDEGDLIEHDLLDLVEQEQQKEQQQRNTPPALPVKKRTITKLAACAGLDTSLDINLETTTKLAHPGKDRPRRSNIRRPIKRTGAGAINDSSSDGGLLSDENDDSSIGDMPSKSISELPVESHSTPALSSLDGQISETPPTTITKFLKSALKTPKPISDEPALPMAKTQPPLPALQARPPAALHPTNHAMSKSVSLSNNDSSQIINSDFSPELFSSKNSMSTSLYTSPLLSNHNGNGNEHREMNNSSESIVSSVPPVLARTGKAAIGTRVLPVLDPNGDAPPVKLRHFQPEKKASPANQSPVLENGLGSDTVSTSAADVSSAPTTNDHHEQYKRLSVKERARMLTTTVPSMSSLDKKSATPTTTGT